MSLAFDSARDELGEMILKEVAIILDTFINMPPEHGVDIPVTKFHALRTPSISLDDYLARISKFSGCSVRLPPPALPAARSNPPHAQNECFIIALIYIDRLVKKRRIRVDRFNIHRLLITSVMIAAKFFDDQYYDNRHYSQVGGVPKEEMNVLELEFLFLLEFNLYVDPKEYDNFRIVLYRRIGVTGASSVAHDPYNNGTTLGPSDVPYRPAAPVQGSAAPQQPPPPASQQQQQQQHVRRGGRQPGGYA